MVGLQRQAVQVWVYLGALALASAGLGFGGYIYAGPYQKAATDLKRCAGDVMTARAEAASQQMELNRLKEDLSDARGSSNPSVTAEHRRRSELRLLKADVESRLAAAPFKMTVTPTRLRLRFPEDNLFEARGPAVSAAGQQVMSTLAAILKARPTTRILIAAPMHGAQVPRWTRAQYPTAADLSAARSGAALRHLVRAGVRSKTMLAVIGTLTDADEAAGAPTLEFEIEL